MKKGEEEPKEPRKVGSGYLLNEPECPNFMELKFLGTGTSCGVPTVGCTCPTCLSKDPRDKRLRCSALLTFPTRGGLRVLIDAGPDLRMQALTHGFSSFDGCVLTHSHSDHICGMSDLREFNGSNSVDVYGIERTLRGVRSMFDYIWNPHTAKGGGLPKIDLHTIEQFKPFVIEHKKDGSDLKYSVTVTSFPVLHGAREISGYVFEWEEDPVKGAKDDGTRKTLRGVAYITDGSELPKESLDFLLEKRPQVFVCNALRYEDHPTHWNVERAKSLAEQIRPLHGTYLIHMNHFSPHARMAALLPPGIQPAFDGLSVLIPLSESTPEDK